MAQMIHVFLPGSASLALRTVDTLGFPINHKTRRGKSLPLPRLPIGVGPDGANDLHLMRGGRGHKDAGIDIASIHQMRGWEQVTRRQVRMDGIEQLGSGDCGIRRHHMGDQVGLIRLTGLR